MQVNELGLTAFLPDPTRTAIGLPANLPIVNFTNNYQLQNTLGVQLGGRPRFAMDNGM